MMASSVSEPCDVRLPRKSIELVLLELEGAGLAPRVSHGLGRAQGIIRQAPREARDESRERDERKSSPADEDQPEASESHEERAGGREEGASELAEELAHGARRRVGSEGRPTRTSYLNEGSRYDEKEQIAGDAPRRGRALFAADERDAEDEELERQRPRHDADQRHEAV